jgi:aspartate aminotransferase
MTKIEPSATLLLAEKARNLAKSGKEVISFSMGEPDFVTPPHICQAAKEAMDKGYTHYTPAVGIPELREAVAEHCSKNNKIPCSNSDVMITPTKLGVYNGVLAAVNSGDEVIIPEPAWVTYEPCVKLAGGKVISLKLSEKDDFRLIPDELAESITKNTKMLIMNSPCNPTGAVYKDSDIKGIAELAVDNDIIVLTDEIYEKIIYEGRHHSIAAQPGMFERTLTVGGFSKSYAMTGWRVGWLIAPPDIFKEVKKLQEHSLTCTTSFAQHGALAALTGPQKCVDDMVKEFKIRRDLTIKLLNEIDGFSCNVPEGAFYAFIAYEFAKNSNDMAAFLLENAGVALTPGSGFGKAGEGYLRMSYAASQKQIKKGISKIKKIIDDI